MHASLLNKPVSQQNLFAFESRLWASWSLHSVILYGLAFTPLTSINYVYFTWEYHLVQSTVLQFTSVKIVNIFNINILQTWIPISDFAIHFKAGFSIDDKNKYYICDSNSIQLTLLILTWTYYTTFSILQGIRQWTSLKRIVAIL